MSDTTLAGALERVGLSAPVRFDEVTRSTQATALEMAAAGAPGWTLVAAAHQTEGRGRRGRTWIDRPGSALMLSIVLRPSVEPALGGLLSLAAGSALALACRDLGVPAACKWPNDVLVQGRKVGGILAESRLAGEGFDHVALGVGVNLGEPPEDAPGAGAVAAGDVELLHAFLAAFVPRYRAVDAGSAEGVVSEYRTLCITLGTRVRATVEDGSVVEGLAAGVDRTGALIVRTGEDERVVRFGEVQHLE